MGDTIQVIDRPTVVKVVQASAAAAYGNLAADLAAHILNPLDSHDASSISYVPSGTLAAINVQGALQEVEVEYLAGLANAAAALAAHLVLGVDSHDASSVSFVPAGGIAAVNVQAAIEELAITDLPAGYVTLGTEQTITATKTFRPTSVAVAGLVVKGAVSQSANLQEWQDSTGTRFASVRNDGLVAAPYFTNTADSGPYFEMNSQFVDLSDRGTPSGALLQVFGGAARSKSISVGTINPAGVPLEVRGAASQTANLQEWQNSAATAVTKVGPDGTVRAPYFTGLVINQPYIEMDTIASVLVKTPSTVQVPLTVRGAASQIANLQEWQSSTPTVVASMGGSLTSTTTRLSLSHVATNTAGQAGALRIGTTNSEWTSLRTSSDGSLAVDMWSGSAFLQRLIVGQTGIGTVGLTVNGVAGQTADLFQAQDSAASVKFSIGPAGTVSLLGESSGGTVLSSPNNRKIGLGGAVSSVASILTVNSNAAGNIAAVIKGAASQTASLTEWQNSAATVLASVAGNGVFVLRAGFDVDNAQASPFTNGVGRITAGAATSVPLTLKGFASQSANLQEWQNSAGTVQASIAPTGILWVRANNVKANAFMGQIANSGSYLYFGAGNATIAAGDPSAAALLVQAAASHTSDLQRWQDSASVVLARVNSVGLIETPYVAPQGNTGPYIRMSANSVQIFNRTSAANAPFFVEGMAAQTGDLTQWKATGGTLLASITSAGLHKWAAANEQTTVGSLGAASALPALPTKWLKVKDSAGTDLVIPAFLAA